MNDPQKTTPVEPSANRLYDSPGDALKKVAEEYGYWSSKLTDASSQMCYALIGANWAIFGGVKGILDEPWSKASMLLVVMALATSIVGSWALTERLRSRVVYGESSPARWEKEFEENSTISSPWPFTAGIDDIGKKMRTIKGLFTLSAGAALIIGALKH